MKRYEFKIARWNEDEIFSSIRSKKDSIRILMKALKIMIINQEVSEEDSIGNMVLLVSKMSRLFFFSADKFFSITFPLTVSESSHGLSYSSRHISDVDSRVTSSVIGLLSASEQFDSDCILEFAEPILGLDDSDNRFWSFMRELLMHEDGYVRYDHDVRREDGHLHPLDHMDIFYSSGGTFKLGLNGRIKEDHLIYILSLETNCLYLHGPDGSPAAGPFA